jgi:hypothetical protein
VSWRHLADDLQDVVLDEFAERDDANAFTTEIDPGDGSDPVPIRAIFDDAALEVVLENEATASVREIRADVAIAELPAYPPVAAWRFRIRRPLEGDPLDDSGVTVFEVWDHRPDGQGLVRLMLRRVRAPAP